VYALADSNGEKPKDNSVNGALKVTAITPHSAVIEGQLWPVAKSGERVDYQMVVRNHHINPISYAQLSSQLPDSFRIETISFRPISRNGANLVWNLPRIAPQDSFTIIISTRVSNKVFAAGYLPFVHSATLTVTKDIDTSDNTDSATVYIVPRLNGSITLTAQTPQQQIIDGYLRDLTYPAETVEFDVTVRNKLSSTIPDAQATLIFPNVITIEQVSIAPASQTATSISWNFTQINPTHSFPITVIGRLKEGVLAEGLSQLSGEVTLTIVEDIDTSDNHDAVDFYAYADSKGKKPDVNDFIPQITAQPSVIDVMDSIQVRVRVPSFTSAWDLWVHLPDGGVDKTFADSYISGTTIQPHQWYNVNEVYHPNYLITTEKQEQIIFEIHAWDIWGNTATAQAAVTIRSGNYLVLDRNIYRPSDEDAIGIRFKLSNRRVAQLDIYDLSGRHITKLTEDVYEGGWNIYPWNGVTNEGKDVGSGVYLVTLRSGEFNSWKKFIIIR
jgi:hypothetical protein